MMHTMEDDVLTTLIDNFGDSNVEQLINYMETDEDDIVKCFNLEGALRAEIEAEFNPTLTVECVPSIEVEEDDDDDAVSTSSGYCSATSSILNYADSKERTSFTYSADYMDEVSQSSGISMCSSDDSFDMSELSLEEVNQSIVDNAKFILKHLQRHSIRDSKLQKFLQICKSTPLSKS